MESLVSESVRWQQAADQLLEQSGLLSFLAQLKRNFAGARWKVDIWNIAQVVIGKNNKNESSSVTKTTN